MSILFVLSALIVGVFFAFVLISFFGLLLFSAIVGVLELLGVKV